MVGIKVTPAEEDEVIVAGASESASEPEPVSVSQPAPGLAVEPQPAPPRERAPKANGARDDERRETTLEDLEPQAMPLAQRIVIIAAVVCIIGALVYYFMVMR